METNPYTESYEISSSNLRLAISFLSKHHIPPSPLNFRTSYDYVAGSNKDLKLALERLLQNSEELSDRSLFQLYRQFFVQDDQALEQMRQELRRIITGIQGEVGRSGADVSDYANTLQDFARILDTSPSNEVMQSEVQRVIDNTRSMEHSQRELESQMSSMLSEVESLRRELEQVREESMTDALTGIANRKAFDAEMNKLCSADGQPMPHAFCVLLLDVDFFKKFNDTFGHLVGDKVLRFIGATLRNSVKGKDLAARYGGEEFAVILPETGVDGAQSLAEQIRRAVSAGKLLNKETGENYGRITISIGISSYLPGDTPATMVKRADQGLYRAKANGRDRVELMLQPASEPIKQAG
ncbi:MAG: diguanylate cyclase [Gammaproteobacteria bacterium]|nr:diguanylate cyclase [Gammaproteobacteria bacterium]